MAGTSRATARGAEDGAGSSPYVLRYDPAIGEGLHGHIDPEFPMGPDMLRGIDLWNVWSKVTCPTLVLRGADSEVLLKKLWKKCKAGNPTCRSPSSPASATRRR